MAQAPDFLTLGDLPGETDDDWAQVEVPEFGDGKSVKVRALSVSEWAFLLRQAYPTGKADEPEFNAAYDEVAITAALCTYDGQGKRVFGKDMGSAMARTAQLHRKYRPALARIHAQVMRLSEVVPQGAGPKED